MCGYKIRLFAHSIGAFLQGVTGSGIGYLGMIGMIYSGIPIRVGIGSNHIVIAVSAILASVTYLIRSTSSDTILIPWNVILITVPAVIIGAQFSPYAADRINKKNPGKYVCRIADSIGNIYVLHGCNQIISKI